MARKKAGKAQTATSGKASQGSATAAKSTSDKAQVVTEEVSNAAPIADEVAATPVAPAPEPPTPSVENAKPVVDEASTASETATSNETEPAGSTEGTAPDEAVATPADSEAGGKDGEVVQKSKPGSSEVVAQEGEGAAEGSGELVDELPLYPVPVKGPGGEEIELQVNPGDNVMDLRQFLAEAPETCFYTCYDLILTTKDGTRYHLIDYIEIGEVTDVVGGGCSLEMFPAFYDERSVRFHVKKFRELVSTAGSFSSHSTSLGAEHEVAHGLSIEKETKDEEEAKIAAAKEDKLPGIPAELEQLGSADASPGLLKGLLVEIGTDDSDCLESVAYSSFNPAPGYRRLQGDLMYFDLATNEGATFCITAHTRGFMVNGSEGRVLNPAPKEPKQEASTLVGLLRLISPSFGDAFLKVLETKAARHPFENMAPPMPPNPWLGVHPLPEHKRQVARAEEALSTPFGTELTGVQRDWNEELQSCRELPRGTVQERMIRDRALYRVTCEFVDAATKGARAVVGRSIPPINPTDPERYHMYVHNSIFFSLAVDGDFQMLQQIREKDLQEQAEAAARKEKGESGEGKEGGESAKGATDKAAPTQEGASDAAPAGEGASEPAGEGESSEAVAQAPAVPDTEQATYASANNDLKGTRLINSVDAAGLSTLAMAIVDFRGHRVIAQSIIPGILYGDKTAALKYGSVDTGAHIKFNEKFHSKMCEVGEVLHLKEHTVTDSEGTTATLCIPVECKGILGSDDRQYLLDLIRLTPRDANSTGPMSRLSVVRPELVETYSQKEAVERWMKASGTEERPSEEKIAELKKKKELHKVAFNPNVLTEFTVAGDAKDVEQDEADVKKLGEYLLSTAIPGLVSDFRSLETSPSDGQALTDAMHAKGINMRYLGKLAKEAESLPHIYKLCVTEMVVRSCKHVLKAVLRETLDQDVGGAIAHFTNCFIGTSATTLFAASATIPVATSPSGPPPTGGTAAARKVPEEKTPPPAAPAAAVAAEPAVTKSDAPAPDTTNTSNAPQAKGKGKKGKGGKGAAKEEKKEEKTEEKKEKVEPAVVEAPKSEEKEEKKAEEVVFDDRPGYTRITAEMVWSDILEGVKFKYQFALPADVRSTVRHLSTLRNLALKMGFVLGAKDYNLASEAPLDLEDVQELLPVVKYTTPICQDAHGLLQKGKKLMTEVGLPDRSKLLGAPLLGHWLQQHQGKLNDAYEAFTEAYNLLQQVTGPLHPEVAECCRCLGTILYNAGESGAAILQQHREIIINERCAGYDHPSTARSYANMALFYHQHEEPELALRHMARTLALLAVTCGPDHPETAATFINLAMIYQDVGKMKPALHYLQDSLKSTERLLGEDHVQTAVCYHALALASSSMRAFKLSVQHEKKAYAILEKQLGKDDERTRESTTWIQNFMRSDVMAQRQKLEAQGPGRPQSVSAVAEALKANPDLLKALQQAGGQQVAALSPQAMAEALVRFHQQGRGGPQAGGGAGGPPEKGLREKAQAQQAPPPPPQQQQPQQQPRGAASMPVPGGMRRGVDERAARAAEIVRRKAAARGMNVRGPAPGGKPTPADIEEILNLASQTAAGGGSESGGSAGKGGSGGGGPKKGATAASSAASVGGSSSRSSGSSHAGGPGGNSPAGLGAGLGIGLGALSGAAPPPKSSGSGRKVPGPAGSSAAASIGSASTNGSAVEKGDEKKPIGLGLGLEPPVKKGKPRGKKVAPDPSAA